MRRFTELRTILGVLLLVGPFVPAPGSALEWDVESYVFATEKPNGIGSSYIWGRGVHQLMITDLDVLDSIIPFRYKVTTGALRHEGAGMDACSTPWQWSTGQSFLKECRTYSLLVPCQNGTWSATTTGRLIFHVDGGTKFDVSPPNLLNCACS
ncbi:MAG: hypothetical protein P8Y44_03990 [Acidobacteriota bacterium]|jgi:hypothetical protein